MTSFCFCGRVGKPQFLGKCARHAGKEEPKKKEKNIKIRGNSVWQKEQGFFNGTKEN